MSSLSFTVLDRANEQKVQEINRLLRGLHSKAVPISVIDLVDHLARSKVLVALRDGQIVGILVLSPNYALSHVSGVIHNVFTDDADARSVYYGLLHLAVAEAKKTAFAFLVLHLNTKRDDADILEHVFGSFDFKQRDYVDFRLLLNH